MIVASRSDSEMPRRFRHCTQVRFVRTGIPDGLAFNERPVTEKVGEHNKFRLGNLADIQWRRRLSRDGHPRSRLEFAKWGPAVEGKERMVSSGLDFTPGCQPDAEYLFDSAGKGMRHDPRHKPQALIHRPDRNVLLTRR